MSHRHEKKSNEQKRITRELQARHSSKHKELQTSSDARWGPLVEFAKLTPKEVQEFIKTWDKEHLP